MAKFDAGTAVERLEYDFTTYGGSEGFISEPSTGRVNDFMASMRGMMKNIKSLQSSAKKFENVEEMDDEALADSLGDIDEASDAASEFQNRSIEFLAILCGAERIVHEDGSVTIEGGEPSYDDLQRLPHRVLQAFTQWLMQEIRPKKEAPATKR